MTKYFAVIKFEPLDCYPETIIERFDAVSDRQANETANALANQYSNGLVVAVIEGRMVAAPVVETKSAGQEYVAFIKVSDWAEADADYHRYLATDDEDAWAHAETIGKSLIGVHWSDYTVVAVCRGPIVEDRR